MSTKIKEIKDKYGYSFEQEVIDKLTKIQHTLALVIEKLELIEERLNKIENKEKKTGKYKIVVNQRRDENRTRNIYSLEIMRKQGIIFESDLKIRNKEKFIEDMRSNGVIVIEGTKERVLVTKEFLDNFISILRECKDIEKVEEKLNEKQLRLYRLLRDSGLLIYNTKTGWILLSPKT
ncbi:MAG: hypothetical protein QW607_02860 [Desulfurococcaceae archaeon]